MNKIKKMTAADVVLIIIMSVWGLTVLYPFYNAILVSFMSQAEYLRNPFALYVANPSFEAYKEILSDNKFFLGYRSTLFILAVRLPLSLIITSAMAYALSRKAFFLSKTINNLTVFTMYFGGGIIPLYLLIKSYGLMGSYWSIIILGLFSVYNMVLIKSYFYSIPDSLEESAKLDGANDIFIYWKIYMPLAGPILATVALFSAVGTWNEWYNPMLFLNDSKKWPLQLVLREIINNATTQLSENALDEDAQIKETFAINVQMASVVVTMLPIMLVYPFLQKYFMRGIMVGAVKG